jgi:hypothetical protein
MFFRLNFFTLTKNYTFHLTLDVKTIQLSLAITKYNYEAFSTKRFRKTCVKNELSTVINDCYSHFNISIFFRSELFFGGYCN